MIALFTDFGTGGPYLGQVKAVLAVQAPMVPVVDLFSDLPSFGIEGAAHLLAAYAPELPEGTVYLCVVDPGVGGVREPCILKADGRWYVGPANGLFDVVAARAADARWWRVDWRPQRLTASFHGRDLFAPVAARLALRGEVEGTAVVWPQVLIDPAEDVARVLYIDCYGNAITGVRASRLGDTALLAVVGRRLARARTFCDVAPGEPFWYANSSGLVEIAVNLGRTDRVLGIGVGSEIEIVAGDEP